MNNLIVHALRLQPGEDLKASLQKFVTERKIRAAAVITCVGSLSHIHLRMAGACEFIQEQAKYEIVSLTGTLSLNGSHLHISLSDQKGKVTGGHVMEGCVVNTTAEVVIGEISDMIFERQPDEKTGYKELIIKSG